MTSLLTRNYNYQFGNITTDKETSELGWKHYNDPDIIDLTVKLNFGGKILECFKFNIDVSKLLVIVPSKYSVSQFIIMFPSELLPVFHQDNPDSRLSLKSDKIPGKKV